ncbi:cell division protein FtsL [Aquicoccus porphyridii]|uniref:Cell division protein FtsL n=1 Tax=Aquicoccus porphyridii TaxID=1852029 RepID=A0A5A9ZSZ5_9RHOB|nr:cell division protein FtsL [Aquicoccus porphyridii]KAA0920317.1 cell division protein FtsL [Aquicoccus porphyridii]RAI54888.1 cell division protein FtsL [Rhodobacteraceae bacterium AsT-22]
MRTLLKVVTAMVVIGLAFWAYHENYRTQEALSQTERLQRDIGAARSRLAMLRAEWAYLNRPDRLRELAAINFDRLSLLPLSADQFGRIDQVAYPAAPLMEIDNAIEVSAGEDDR